MGKFTAYNDNYWACDFETVSVKTNYFKENQKTKVWLAYAKRFSPKKEEIQEDEILTISIEEFFEQFFARKESATLFFHNLSFDGEFIKWYLQENGFQYFYEAPERKTSKGFMLFEDDGNIYFIQCWKKVRVKNSSKVLNLYIRCSNKLLTLSIESLAKAYKLPYKLDLDYHTEPFDRLEGIPQDKIEYIKRDVEIMIPPLQNFNEVFTIKYGNQWVSGLSKLTIGSVSLTQFKAYNFKKYSLKKDFYLPYEDVLKVKQWYSGGLTTFVDSYQTKITEEINGKVYDVNSMYPSVMVDYEYPIGRFKISDTQPSPDYKIKMVKIFIKNAKIKSDKYPPLMRPWLSMTKTYPKGVRFVKETENCFAYYFQDELDSLKRFYEIDYEVIETLWFQSAPYFKDFINHFYNIRKQYKESGDPREQTIKLLLNSAYGKFGQKPDKTSIIYSTQKLEKGETIFESEGKQMIIDVVRNEDSCIGDLYSYICYYAKSPEKSINIAIAACVTKNARLKLHNAIWENIDNFLYCDTDSVFLKDEAKGIEIDENKLGAWKLEMEFDGFELGGAKLYNLYLKNVKVKSAHAGINKKWALANLKKGDIIKIDYTLPEGSKLLKKKVKGGIVLIDTEYTIKERK